MTTDTVKGFTHNGIFHADDVFSTAFLMLVFPGFEYARGEKVPDNFDGIVYDIGLGEFDHHQNNRRLRNNGVPYSSFGLLWDAYGELLLSKEDADEFEREFVVPIDESDNLGVFNPISRLIKEFNPTWDESLDSDIAFDDAVLFALGILKRHIKMCSSKNRANRLLDEYIKKTEGNVLVLERWVPWHDRLADSRFTHIVFPSLRGGFITQIISKHSDMNRSIVTFPKEWFGKKGAELEKISKIDGLVFCHASGFLCVSDTKEAAIEVARR